MNWPGWQKSARSGKEYQIWPKSGSESSRRGGKLGPISAVEFGKAKFGLPQVRHNMGSRTTSRCPGPASREEADSQSLEPTFRRSSFASVVGLVVAECRRLSVVARPSAIGRRRSSPVGCPSVVSHGSSSGFGCLSSPAHLRSLSVVGRLSSIVARRSSAVVYRRSTTRMSLVTSHKSGAVERESLWAGSEARV